MPKCTINGKEVEVENGQTIMDAFYKLGEDIAYYCWHPGLKIAGVCRMCMVDIEGNPRLQIACNTPVAEGMKISNKSDKVKDAVKWTLDFHLINHPLDCPICDQAGECGLQEYYMAFGKYEPEMSKEKVKKSKAVDLGPEVVLDSERCILCSRCVRFTSDVTKTNELGIFNRGDHAEVGCVDGQKLDNKYSVNVVDICPVGALTAKDFRFRQRSWYLQEFETVCNGCSTGCNVKVSYNQHGLWRVKPVFNKDVNKWWMCDEGRNIYKFVNPESRLKHAKIADGAVSRHLVAKEALKELGEKLRDSAKKNSAGIAVVLTGQYTTEEYKSFTSWFKKLGANQFYHWKNNEADFEKFDGLLIRGDKNPNTKGLESVLADVGAGKWADLEAGLKAGKIKTVVVAGPENISVYPDVKEKIELFAKAEVIWFGAAKHPSLEKATFAVPTKTFAEKSGTFTNYSGREQRIKKGVDFVPEAVTLAEAVEQMESESRVSRMAEQTY